MLVAHDLACVKRNLDRQDVRVVKESDLNITIYLMGSPASVQIRLLAFVFFLFTHLVLPRAPHCARRSRRDYPRSSCLTACPRLPPYNLLCSMSIPLTGYHLSFSLLLQLIRRQISELHWLPQLALPIELHIVVCRSITTPSACPVSVPPAPHCLFTNPGRIQAVLRPGTPDCVLSPGITGNLGEY